MSSSTKLLSGVAERITAQTGLSLPTERAADLMRCASIVACDLRYPTTDDYLTSLLADRCRPDDIETLASHLTVGETYFFREPRSFEAFEQWLTKRIARGDRGLRVWSAGCCTGEEPYSIAMLLDRAV